MEIRSPKTVGEFKQYYELRWQLLRKPWKQPKGSEKDDKEDEAFHIIAKEKDNIIGVGRLHFNSEDEAQVRYMAVDKESQGKGVGSRILKELEGIAEKNGAKRIVLNARESAIEFYKKNNYKIIKKGHTLFGSIRHYKMSKSLRINQKI
jgi:N-acetylglutamate synthase-like GNAT family acetyltransferase